ncbi:MAG: NAD-dependent epimerase/dehydratase family protein [Promethearchaeota archaeon]
MQYLVLGAEGFIGFWVMKYLKDAIGLGKKECDITRREKVKEVIEKYSPRVVINLAGISNPTVCMKNRELSYEVNVKGVENIITCGTDCEKIILMSTAQAYMPSNQPISEDSPLKKSGTPYVMHKILMERVSKEYENTIIIRPFNQEGPGRGIDYFTSQVIEKACTGQELELWNPDEVRDILDVRDGARGIITIAEKGAVNQAYNLCSGKGVSKLEYVKNVELILNKRIKYHITIRKNEEKRVGDNSKLKKLGWKPEHTLEETIIEQWRSMKKSLSSA